LVRKHIKKNDEADVLVESRRRCSICFGLYGDFSIKRGQIAHLDGDKENNNRSNLTFLCLPHHDEYDSRTSQSKGLNKKEVLHYQSLLKEHIISIEVDNEKRVKAPITNNNFCLYKLTNSESVCGFDFLATDKERDYYLEISEDIVSIQKVYWEVNQWINQDYTETGISLNFPLTELVDIISKVFFEEDFSIIGYKDKGGFNSLVISFNESDRYYEIEFCIENGLVNKSIGTSKKELNENSVEARAVLGICAILNNIKLPH
jgi:hypothetical protein